jgi:hypothetical protein
VRNFLRSELSAIYIAAVVVAAALEELRRESIRSKLPALNLIAIGCAAAAAAVANIIRAADHFKESSSQHSIHPPSLHSIHVVYVYTRILFPGANIAARGVRDKMQTCVAQKRMAWHHLRRQKLCHEHTHTHTHTLLRQGGF